MGPTHLIEEPLSGATAEEMCRLGPNYVGSFQAPCPEGILRVVSGVSSDVLSTPYMVAVRDSAAIPEVEDLNV